MKKTLILALFCLFPYGSALAEPSGAISSEHRNFLKLLYFHKSEVSARYEIHTEADESDGPGAFDLQSLSLDLDFPVSLSRDSYLSLGGGYHAKQLDFNEVLAAPTFEDDTTLHSIFLKGGFGHFFTNNVFLLGTASIGSYSDLSDNLDGDAIKVFGEGMIVYRLNPGAALLAGARYSEDFDGTPLFPIFGLRIQDSDGRFHVSLTIPVELKLSYHADKNTELFLRGWIEGDEYLVELGPADLEFNAQHHERKIAAGVRQWLGNHFAITLEIGGSIGSELEYEIESPGQFTDGDLDNSVFGSLSLDIVL